MKDVPTVIVIGMGAGHTALTSALETVMGGGKVILVGEKEAQEKGIDPFAPPSTPIKNYALGAIGPIIVDDFKPKRTWDHNPRHKGGKRGKR